MIMQVGLYLFTEDIEELKQTAKKAGDPDFHKLRLQKQAGYFPTNRLLDDILR